MSYSIILFMNLFFIIILGAGQNLERRDVEQPVFRNFEIANIKIKKDELFDNFIFDLFFIFWKLFEHAKYSIIFDIVKY